MTDTSSAPLAVTLATRVEQLTLDDIPPAVRATAGEHLLDALGTAVAASTMDFGEAIHRAGTTLGSGRDSHVIGFGTELPAASAALVNGTLMHGLDFDDTHIGAIYHPTAPALAAALATAEAIEASGAQLLLAYIIGVEVGCRLATAGAYKFHARGFHPTAICGTFAAACVAAKLRGLPASTLTSALGLCGSQAAGILELHESWLKRMHPGWAAHAGLCAVAMAEAGFRGPATVFEGAGGFYRSHLGETPSAKELGLEDLGQRWMTSEVALKPYPCCHFTHAFVDASFAILGGLGRDRLAPEDVAEIICPTAPGLLPIVVEPLEMRQAPETIYDALFSIPYVTARALTTRRIDLAAFYDEDLDDPDVLAMAAKVSCPEDPDTDFPAHFPGQVRVTLKDGRVASKEIPASYGTFDWPMSSSDVAAKFMANATRRLSEDQAQKLQAVVNDLETLPQARALLREATAS
jgi:2-methylcitrate dehydratase PrpD